MFAGLSTVPQRSSQQQGSKVFSNTNFRFLFVEIVVVELPLGRPGQNDCWLLPPTGRHERFPPISTWLGGS
jgi:hypothetical protein